MGRERGKVHRQFFELAISAWGRKKLRREETKARISF